MRTKSLLLELQPKICSRSTCSVCIQMSVPAGALPPASSAKCGNYHSLDCGDCHSFKTRNRARVSSGSGWSCAKPRRRLAMYSSMRKWCLGSVAALALTATSTSTYAEELAENLGPVGPNEPILTTVGGKRVIAFYEAS